MTLLRLYASVASVVFVAVTGSNLYHTAKIIHQKSKKTVPDGLAVSSLGLFCMVKGIGYGSTWPTYLGWLLYKKYHCPQETIRLTYGSDYQVIVQKNSLQYQAYPNTLSNERKIHD